MVFIRRQALTESVEEIVSEPTEVVEEAEQLDLGGPLSTKYVLGYVVIDRAHKRKFLRFLKFYDPTKEPRFDYTDDVNEAQKFNTKEEAEAVERDSYLDINEHHTNPFHYRSLSVYPLSKLNELSKESTSELIESEGQLGEPRYYSLEDLLKIIKKLKKGEDSVASMTVEALIKNRECRDIGSYELEGELGNIFREDSNIKDKAIEELKTETQDDVKSDAENLEDFLKDHIWDSELIPSMIRDLLKSL